MSVVLVDDTFITLRKYQLTEEFAAAGKAGSDAHPLPGHEESDASREYVKRRMMWDDQLGVCVKLHDHPELHKKFNVAKDISTERGTPITLIVGFSVAPSVSSPIPIRIRIEEGGPIAYKLFTKFLHEKNEAMKSYKSKPKVPAPTFRVVAGTDYAP